MAHNIEAIFLDLGNTLRILLKDTEHQSAARQKIVELVGTNEDPKTFCEKLNARYKTYRKWAFAHLTEAPESELWTRWMTPDFPAEKIAPLGSELTYQFRQSMGRRVVVEHGREVVEELRRRGYTLGIISNLIGTRNPGMVAGRGFAPYFKPVVLSSFREGKHSSGYLPLKPRLAGVEPSCAYVGDNLTRCLTGTRQSGFGMVVIMISARRGGETITDGIARM
jgi:FMN phosphatase YigB (HAD superfamily)